MKKLLWSFGVLYGVSFFALLANAQQLMIGARIGSNLANVSLIPNSENENITSTSINAGFLGGGQIDYCFNDMWALSLQVLYDQKGSQKQFNNSYPGISTEVVTREETLNYLEIPLVIKANLGNGNMRPYVFVGPSAGIFLSATERYNATVTQGGQSTSQSISGNDIAVEEATDISVIFGAGISQKLNSGQTIFIDAAYAYGLIHIFEDDAFSTSRDIRLAAGILFPL